MKKYLLLCSLLAACNSGTEYTSKIVEENFGSIVEYTPAPGQFINEPKSGFDQVTTADEAVRYAEERLRKGNFVSLGGWGGYLVAAFATPVPAAAGNELWVRGNQFSGSSEPGVVWVMQDTNGDGVPNDGWVQLQGSRFDSSIQNYWVEYTRTADYTPTTWLDKNGATGSIDRIGATTPPEGHDDSAYAGHVQANYYPAWVASGRRYEGVLLPSNVTEPSEGYFVQVAFEWGYADNYSTLDGVGTLTRLSIANAVHTDGTPAHLTQVDFVKVQTAINAKAPSIGEISTEVCGIGCYRTVTSE